MNSGFVNVVVDKRWTHRSSWTVFHRRFLREIAETHGRRGRVCGHHAFDLRNLERMTESGPRHLWRVVDDGDVFEKFGEVVTPLLIGGEATEEKELFSFRKGDEKEGHLVGEGPVVG